MKTYRQLHKQQQQGELPNVGKSPYGFDWRELPALARLYPDAPVKPAESREDEDKSDKQSRASPKQSRASPEQSRVPPGQSQAPLGQNQAQQHQRRSNGNERREPDENNKDADAYTLNLKHGGYAQQDEMATPQMSAQSLMRNALSKLSGGFDTRLTPQYDSVKLIKRLSTARDYSIARREEDGNPTVLFIGDNSPSCAHMVAQMTQILLYASKLGTRGCDVWLLIASNGQVLQPDAVRYEKHILKALLSDEMSGQKSDISNSMRLYRNGKLVSIQKLIKKDVRSLKTSENNLLHIVDAIAPTHLFNVGDADSSHLFSAFMERKSIKVAHVYSLYGRWSTFDAIYNPIRGAIHLHKNVRVARVSTPLYPTPTTVALFKGGDEKSEDGESALWQIAYAVNFICSPEKLHLIPVTTFQFVF